MKNAPNAVVAPPVAVIDAPRARGMKNPPSAPIAELKPSTAAVSRRAMALLGPLQGLLVDG